MNKIHVVIPTIQEREHVAGPLLEQLQAGLGGSVELYEDVDRSLVMSHPKGFFRGLETGRRWCAVAEDDILLCDDFWDRLDWVLEQAEQQHFQVLKLYNNQAGDLQELEAGKSWRRIPGRLYSMVSQYFRRDMTKEIVDFSCSDCHVTHNVWHDLLYPFDCPSCGVRLYTPTREDQRKLLQATIVWTLVFLGIMALVIWYRVYQFQLCYPEISTDWWYCFHHAL